MYRKNSVHYDKTRGDFFGTIEEVFNVRDDKKGYPHFLIHKNGEWKYESAKNFAVDLKTILHITENNECESN